MCICVFLFVCLVGWCHDEHVKLTGELCGVDTFTLMWVSMIQLWSPGLHSKYLQPLSHLTGLKISRSQGRSSVWGYSSGVWRIHFFSSWFGTIYFKCCTASGDAQELVGFPVKLSEILFYSLTNCQQTEMIPLDLERFHHSGTVAAAAGGGDD